MAHPPVIVNVDLGPRSYDIHVGPGLIDQLGNLLRNLSDASRLTIVTDKNVATLYSKRAVESLEAAGFVAKTITIPPGESSKSLDMAARLYDGLADRRHGRRDPILALGGGVVGDLAGFVAATWMRGVPFVQCPTTTESMIDAGVGGKTAVNHESGKNLIGAFHQPLIVVMDTDTTKTLDERDYVAGLAESVKHALIADAGFLEWHERHVAEVLNRNPPSLTELIVRNCRIKAAVVQADEREQSAASVGRAALNFGHTVGHAIESVSQGRLRHGEAVSLGMLVALKLSTELVHLSAQIRERTGRLLASMQLPVKTNLIGDLGDVLGRIKLDKKNTDSVRFVLLESIGRPVWLEAPPLDAVTTAMSQIIGQ